MGCGSSKPSLPQIVILGGSFAGACIAHLLQDEDFCKVILIDSFDVLQHEPAIPRCIVEPEFLKQTFISYHRFIHNFLQDSVISINTAKKLILLKSGKKVNFDYLVLAMGDDASFPKTLEGISEESSISEIVRHYKDFTEEMKKSPEIVVVGNDTFAIETAGEVRTDYPDKKVSIISPKETLLSNQLPEEFQTELNDRFYRKEVDLFLGDHIKNENELTFNKSSNGQILETSSGKRVPADLLVRCESTQKTRRLLKESFPETSLDKQGGLLIEADLKVRNYVNIYAINGVSRTGDEMSIATEQAAILANNLIRDVTKNGVRQTFQQEITFSHNGSKFAPLKKQCTSTVHLRIALLPIDGRNAMVSIGRYGGVGVKNGKIIDDDDVMEAKSENLFTAKFWKQFGFDIPNKNV